MLKEAFEIGFYHRLAEYGISPSKAETMLEKRALGEDVVTTLALAGLLTPIAGGMLTGWGHSAITSPSAGEFERVLRAQRTNMIRQQAKKLKHQIKKMKSLEEPETETETTTASLGGTN